MITTIQRPLLVLMLILAVPAQGLAALSAGLCMTLGHDAAISVAAHGPDAPDESAARAIGHDHEGTADGSFAHCGPCVACCASVAIVESRSILAAGAGSDEVARATVPGSPQHLPDVLDPPPLTLRG